MTLVPEITSAAASPGDSVYLGSVISRLHLWAQVSDLDTPAMMSGSLEVLGDDSALVLDALVGDRGPAGQHRSPVKLVWNANIKDPADLPTTLGDNDNDRGTAYWIGNQIFAWSGRRWQVHAMGTVGPPGPVPRVSPSVLQLDPDGDEEDDIDVTGTTMRPSWQFKLRMPKGPTGPVGEIRNALDYDGEMPMAIGDVLTCLQSPSGIEGEFMWGPRAFHGRHVKMFSVPEGAFQNYLGFTQGHQILGYTIEPQPYDYVPFCLGHIKAVGVELDQTPLQIGVAVRLGHPLGGTLIGRGHGSPLGWTTLAPHWTTPGDPYTSTSPKAPTGLVNAGEEGQIFVTLQSEGLIGAYLFNRTGAQLTILCVPTELAFA